MRVEFVLSMPSNNSWNGRWSGEGRHYAIVKTMTARAVRDLLGDAAEKSWTYSFGDGWVAAVTAREVLTGKRVRKSDGFCGYDWMVDSIIRRGAILGAREGVAS